MTDKLNFIGNVNGYNTDLVTTLDGDDEDFFGYIAKANGRTGGWLWANSYKVPGQLLKVTVDSMREPTIVGIFRGKLFFNTNPIISTSTNINQDLKNGAAAADAENETALFVSKFHSTGFLKWVSTSSININI